MAFEKENEMRVMLGDKVKCQITGFEGIATAITEFIHGCRRVQICAPLKNGSYQDERWADEPQLTVTQVKAYQSTEDIPYPRVVGGDRPDCPPR